jgi:hypothetical protein
VSTLGVFGSAYKGKKTVSGVTQEKKEVKQIQNP